MGNRLDNLTIKGFKSICCLEEFPLDNINVLIGGNGSGKSNFIDLFRMLRAMMELSLPELAKANLTTYIKSGGGINDFLFNGPKITKQIEIKLIFGDNGYGFKLIPTANEEFVIDDEKRYYKHSHQPWWNMGGGYTTPGLLDEKDKPGARGYRSVASYIWEAIDSWRIYHFHDTSKSSPMRGYEIVQDNEYLRFDASNIAPFLLFLKEREKEAYDKIVTTVRLVTPFFDDFILKPRMFGEKEKINLSWRQKGSDYPMQPYHFSDGTIRFICLATALLQPNPPSTLIVDEPELGLHPYAIDILAELIKSSAQKTQIIVSTQSPALVDNFEPQNIIVVCRKGGTSTFKRLSKEELNQWLEEYSIGDLWRKNIIAGGPVHE
jgi:predicted ATPase